MTKALVIMSFAYGFFMAALIDYNLPNWCAHPEVGGNYLVQPFCKSKGE